MISGTFAATAFAQVPVEKTVAPVAAIVAPAVTAASTVAAPVAKKEEACHVILAPQPEPVSPNMMSRRTSRAPGEVSELGRLGN